jgi:hypothetical protein
MKFRQIIPGMQWDKSRFYHAEEELVPHETKKLHISIASLAKVAN